MPAIQKQNAKGPATKRSAGSILSKAVPVSDVRSRFLKMVAYGENRVGKTTFASTFPKPILMISFEPSEEGGQTSISHMKNIDVLRYKRDLFSREDFIKLINELGNDTHYKTHVLDTGTSFQDAVLAELLNLDKLPEQLSFGGISTDKYRQRAELVKEALRPFLALEANTLILNKEKDHRPKSKGEIDMTPEFMRMKSIELDSFIASDMGGAVVGWLHDACSCICRLYLAKEVKEIRTKLGGKESVTYRETGKMERRLRTLYHPNFAAGFRAPIGVEIPEHIVSPDYNKVAQYYFAEV